MSASLRLRLFERNCAAVDASFADVQDELTKSMRSFEAKTHHLGAIQSRRGKSWREMMNREEKLNEYADSIMQRLRIIQKGRERINKHVKSMDAHFQFEWEESQRQLEFLREQEILLADTRRILSEDNVRLYQSIIENETQANSLSERESISEISIHNMLASNLDETIDSFEVQAELQRTEIDDLDRRIAKTKEKLSKLDSVQKKQKQEVGNIKLSIEKWKKKLRSSAFKHHQIENKLKNKMEQLNDKSYSYSQREKDASMRSSSIQSRNNFTISEIRSSERNLSATKRRIAAENQKTEHLETSLVTIKEQSVGIAQSMTDLQDERSRQTNTASKSKEKMKTLQYELQKMKCDLTKTIRDLDKEQLNVKKREAEVAAGEEAVKEAMKIYDKIELLEEQEEELKEKLEAVIEANRKPIFVDNDTTVVQIQDISTTREQEQSELLNSETTETAHAKELISEIETDIERKKSEQEELQNEMKEAEKIPPELWKGNTKPTAKAVKDYVTKRENERAKRMKSKTKAVNTLEKRAREGTRRIELVKKKTDEQKKMLKELDSVESVSQTNDLGSFQRKIMDEMSTWEDISESEVETILKRWDEHISGLAETHVGY